MQNTNILLNRARIIAALGPFKIALSNITERGECSRICHHIIHTSGYNCHHLSRRVKLNVAKALMRLWTDTSTNRRKTYDLSYVWVSFAIDREYIIIPNGRPSYGPGGETLRMSLSFTR